MFWPCQSLVVIGVHGAYSHVLNGNYQQKTLVRSERQSFCIQTYDAAKKDTANKMHYAVKKGVSFAMHCKSLTPDNLFLHSFTQKWDLQMRTGKALKAGLTKKKK